MSRLKADRCTAKKRDGTPCKMWAIRGGTVCRCHGGQLPVVRAAAARRVAIHEALESGDRRHPWEVLFDALHGADVLMREMRVRLGDTETPEAIAEFIKSFERAAQLAKMTLDSRAQEYAATRVQVEAEMIVGLFSEAIDAAHLDEDTEHRLRRALGDALRRRDELERRADPDPAPAPRGVGDRTVVDGRIVA